jgi:uncharacterized protein DUF6174
LDAWICRPVIPVGERTGAACITNIMTFGRTFLLILSLALTTEASSCRLLIGPDAGDTRDLRQARERWASRGLSSYEYVVRNQCFCGYGGVAVRVVVSQGSVQSVTVVATGEPVDPTSRAAYRDVEGLFGVIDDAIDQDAARLDVDYDDLYGFPVRVFIDYRRNAADEEFGWTIDTFQPR